MQQPVALYRACFPGRAAFDTALSRALLASVASDGRGATLRLYRPDPVLAFSGLDATRPGFAKAVRAALELGFEPVLRLAGGRAAVFHPGTLAFAWSQASPEPRRGIRRRFEEMAGMVAAALQRLGVDARVGEVPGEYCPGEHSVNARGRTKLMGVGQRVVRGAAHVGGVIVVRDAERVREALVPVYRELALELDPDAAGSVEEEIGAVSTGDVEQALLAEFGRRYPYSDAELEEADLALAAELEAQHRVEAVARRAPTASAAGSPGG